MPTLPGVFFDRQALKEDPKGREACRHVQMAVTLGDLQADRATLDEVLGRP